MSAGGSIKRALARARASLQRWTGMRGRRFGERREVVERRRGATWQVAVALVCSTLGAAALGYLAIQLFFLPETVAQSRLNRVPDLTGKDVEDALEAGEGAGYVVIRTGGQYSDEVDPGEVLYQIPPPASYLQRGDSLWILTSLGPSEPTVPDLTGVEPEIARGVLSRLGVPMTASRRAPSDLHPQGTVIETVPPVGTAIDEETRVTLVISRGGSFLEMPDVTGLPLAAARDSLESFGLSVGEVTGVGGEQATGEGSVVVVSQTPGAFRRVRAGAAVALQLGERPRQREAPAPPPAEERDAPEDEDAVVEQPSAAERRRMEEERRAREAAEAEDIPPPAEQPRREVPEQDAEPPRREAQPLPVPETPPDSTR